MGRNRQLRVELTGPIGCLVGSLLLALGLAILIVIAVAGLIALSLAFWLAAALVAFGAISVLLRRRKF